ncbi:MAG: GDSL-type esterase/lipase family protein [Lachnospiraceae bacterium]
MTDVLCFGDSNTWGYNPKDGSRFSWEIRWTGRLQKELQGDGIRVLEEGLCGRTTIFEDPLRQGRRGTELFPVLLETHGQPEFITLMLGTNDCKTVFSASADVIGKGVARLLEQARQCAPKSRVLVISPIYLGEQVWEDGFDPEFSPESVEVSKRLGDVL